MKSILKPSKIGCSSAVSHHLLRGRELPEDLPSGWREFGQRLRNELLKSDIHNVFTITNSIPLENYLEIIHRVQEQFNCSYHHKTNLEQTFIIGNRILLFLCKVLPTHQEYFHERFQDATFRIEEDIKTIKSRLGDVALWLDLDIYYSSAINSKHLKPSETKAMSVKEDSSTEEILRSPYCSRKVTFSDKNTWYDFESIGPNFSHNDIHSHSHNFSTSVFDSNEGISTSESLDLWLCRDPDLEIVNMSQDSIASQGSSLNYSTDDFSSQVETCDFSFDASFEIPNNVLEKSKQFTPKLMPPKKEAKVNPLREQRRRQLQLDRPSAKICNQNSGKMHDKPDKGSPTSLFDLDLKSIVNDDAYDSTIDGDICSDPFETFTMSVQDESDFSFAGSKHISAFSNDSILDWSDSKQPGTIRIPNGNLFAGHDSDIQKFDFNSTNERSGDMYDSLETHAAYRQNSDSNSKVTPTIHDFNEESDCFASENNDDPGNNCKFPDESHDINRNVIDLNPEEQITMAINSNGFLDWRDNSIDISVSIDDGSIEEDLYSGDSHSVSSFPALDNSFTNDRAPSTANMNAKINEKSVYEDLDNDYFIRSKIDPLCDEFSQSIDSSKLSRATSSTAETEGMTIDEDQGSCLSQRSSARRIANVGYELDYLESKVHDLRIRKECIAMNSLMSKVRDETSNNHLTSKGDDVFKIKETDSEFRNISVTRKNSWDRHSPHDEIDELELSTQSIHVDKSETVTSTTSSPSYSKYAPKSARSLTSARIRAIKSTSAWKRRYGTDAN